MYCDPLSLDCRKSPKNQCFYWVFKWTKAYSELKNTTKSIKIYETNRTNFPRPYQY